MAARSRMRYTATVERPKGHDVDPDGDLQWDGTWDEDGGNTGAGAPVSLSALPCHWWAGRETRINEEGKLLSVAHHRMMVPLGSDITEGDRVTRILDNRGETIIESVMRVLSALPRRDHVAIGLEEVT